MTSAPSSSSRTRSSLACSRARVTTTERPNSGRASNHERSRWATSPTAIAGGGADGARDAGHDLERDPGRGQCLGFLAPAAEHERVAALQANDAPGGAAPVDEHLVDLLLGEVDLARRLARGDQLGVVGRERQ